MIRHLKSSTKTGKSACLDGELFLTESKTEFGIRISDFKTVPKPYHRNMETVNSVPNLLSQKSVLHTSLEILLNWHWTIDTFTVLYISNGRIFLLVRVKKTYMHNNPV